MVYMHLINHNTYSDVIMISPTRGRRGYPLHDDRNPPKPNEFDPTLLQKRCGKNKTKKYSSPK